MPSSTCYSRKYLSRERKEVSYSIPENAHNFRPEIENDDLSQSGKSREIRFTGYGEGKVSDSAPVNEHVKPGYVEKNTYSASGKSREIRFTGYGEGKIGDSVPVNDYVNSKYDAKNDLKSTESGKSREIRFTGYGEGTARDSAPENGHLKPEYVAKNDVSSTESRESREIRFTGYGEGTVRESIPKNGLLKPEYVTKNDMRSTESGNSREIRFTGYGEGTVRDSVSENGHVKPEYVTKSDFRSAESGKSREIRFTGYGEGKVSAAPDENAYSRAAKEVRFSVPEQYDARLLAPEGIGARYSGPERNGMSLLGSYDETDSFVDYQTRMVGAAKEISRLATEMMVKCVSESSRLVSLGNELSQQYGRLAQDSVGAAGTTHSADVAHRIRESARSLGEAVSELIKAGGHCHLSATSQNQRTLHASAKLVNEKVVSVLGALQEGSKGTQACIDAVATVAAIIGDLDTTILFASAGTLNSEKEGDQFSEHRESILKTAKALVEDTKTLVGGAAHTQDQLAEAAHNAVTTIVHLAEVVKLGAMSLGSGNPESQVLVIHGVRDVAAALRDVIHATKEASGKHVGHPAMDKLKTSARRSEKKRWSLPNTKTSLQRPRRWSINLNQPRSTPPDSDTDWLVSDQEDELLKLIDYSSQDDDISPTIFYDNCEEVISYIDRLLNRIDEVKPPPNPNKDFVNEGYNLASRNSLVDMDWRVVKYGENLLLGEIRKFVDNVEDVFNREGGTKKIKEELTAGLDKEMNRLSQLLDDLVEVDEMNETTETVRTIRTIQTNIINKRPNNVEPKVETPVFRVKKVKPVNLVTNLDSRGHTPEPAKANIVVEVKEDDLKNVDLIEVEGLKSEPTPIIVVPDVIELGKIYNSPPKKSEILKNKDLGHNTKVKNDLLKVDEARPKDTTSPERRHRFWEIFSNETDIWKQIAKRNLEKNEETRKALERFSGHELVLGDFEKEFHKYEKEKTVLQNFIEDIDTAKTVNKTLEYDKKYEEMVLKLIEFAKKDFIYKGFDSLIEQLKRLSKLELEKRKNMNTEITKYSYEELCRLEKEYIEIVKKYKSMSDNKENCIPNLNNIPAEKYKKYVIMNINSREDNTKNVTMQKCNNSSHVNNQNKAIEIYDLTRTYPLEYYAKNWWSIYEDILRTREQQFGSIDNWWKFYEKILNKHESNDIDSEKLKSVVLHRNTLRKRPKSRLEEHMKLLDDVKNEKFKETEAVTSKHSEEAQESVWKFTNYAFNGLAIIA